MRFFVVSTGIILLAWMLSVGISRSQLGYRKCATSAITAERNPTPSGPHAWPPSSSFQLQGSQVERMCEMGEKERKITEGGNKRGSSRVEVPLKWDNIISPAPA